MVAHFKWFLLDEAHEGIQLDIRLANKSVIKCVGINSHFPVEKGGNLSRAEGQERSTRAIVLLL